MNSGSGTHQLGEKSEKVKMLSAQSCSTLAATWATAHQAPLSMGFSWQEYWSGLPSPSPGDLRSPGFEPKSPALQTDSLLSESPDSKAQITYVENSLYIYGLSIFKEF